MPKQKVNPRLTKIESKSPIKGISEVLYLSEKYPDRKALEADTDFWDASTAGQYSWCPRNAQYSRRMGLVQRDEALTLLTGNAIHAGADVLHASGDEDLAVEVVVKTFGDREPPAPSHPYAHLHTGFVEAVFKNYLEWRKKHETFVPLVVQYDDLDLTDVVAAILRVFPSGRVILGESKLVMRFDVDGQELLYSGKPDLPIQMGQRLYIQDWKVSCGGYLSDWYFEKHVVSNQLRGYLAMLTTLLGRRFEGAYIGGIYVGEHALETHTKAGKPSTITKFAPYGPLLFKSDHLEEALWNQYAWRQMAFAYQDLAKQHPYMYKRFGYPQNTGKSCQGCSFLPLCKAQPKARRAVIAQKYVQRQRKFLDL